MASLFDAFTPQAGNAPIPPPNNYVMQSSANGYQPQPSYQPTRTAPPSGGGVSAPAGVQDQMDAYLGGQPISARPMVNSATGQPLDKTGQVDESQVDTRSLWQRMGIGGRLGQGLETGSMLASMIPGGRTIGENIAQVSGAIHNLPLAELEHAYQMGQPGLQRAQALLGLGMTQSEIQKNVSQAEYTSGRNQAAILAQQLRGQSAEQLRAQAGKAIPRWDVATEDGIGPNGVPFKKGQRVWGYDVPQYTPGNPQDMTDPGTLQHTFQPQSTEDEEMKARWGMGGGGSYQQHYINEYLQQYPQGKSGTLTNQMEVQKEALDDFNLHNKTMPGLAILQGGAGIPQRPTAPQVDRSKSDEEEYKQILLPDKQLKPTDVMKMSPQTRQSYGLDPDPFNPNFMQDPGKVQDFVAQHNKQISSYKAEYERLPRAQQTGFQDFLVNKGYNPQTHQFAQAGPKLGDVKTFPNGKTGKWDGKGWVAQ